MRILNEAEQFIQEVENNIVTGGVLTRLDEKAEYWTRFTQASSININKVIRLYEFKDESKLLVLYDTDKGIFLFGQLGVVKKIIKENEDG